jgi:outer membrane immunogenic protein
MRGLILGASLLAFAFSGSAIAADLPIKAAPAPVQEAVFTWTGFYIGGHVGWGWARTKNKILEADNNFFPQNHVLRNDVDGFLGGGQIGFNYQTGQFVFGVEVDGTWSDIGGRNGTPAVLLANRLSDNEGSVHAIVLATGRLGLAYGNALFYVKGGGAWARFDNVNFSRNTANNTILQVTSGNENRSGWTIGGGLEYAFSGNWSVKGEYNFVDFGNERVTRTGLNYGTGEHVTRFREHDTTVQMVKFGINYRFFGGGVAPIAARY